jgi:hypothetical protein
MKNFETISIFQLNKLVLDKNSKDMTHEDSLISSEKGGNSFNWVVGHILVSRDDLREMIGLERLCNEMITNLYKRGSLNFDSLQAMPLEDILKSFMEGQAEIENKIAETDYTGKPEALKDLTTVAFHEAYHVGQTGILRRIAGKDGAIK